MLSPERKRPEKLGVIDYLPAMETISSFALVVGGGGGAFIVQKCGRGKPV